METFDPIVDNIVKGFRTNVESVNKLIDFDNLVLEFAIKNLESLCKRLREDHGVNNPRLTAEHTLKQIKSIREHGSMKSQYQEIFNQGVVLLVSYFGSALQDLFEKCIAFSLSVNGKARLLNEELKMTVSDIKNKKFDLTDHIGEFLISSRNISFQDMQSIHRAFLDYLDVDSGKDAIANNIILGQACRHVIVHNGAIVNNKLLNQIQTAKPRTLKLILVEDSQIEFTPHEVRALGNDMLQFVDRLIEKLRVVSSA